MGNDEGVWCVLQVKCLPMAGRLDSLLAAFLAHISVNVEKFCRGSAPCACRRQCNAHDRGFASLELTTRSGTEGNWPGKYFTDEERRQIFTRLLDTAASQSRVCVCVCVCVCCCVVVCLRERVCWCVHVCVLCCECVCMVVHPLRAHYP